MAENIVRALIEVISDELSGLEEPQGDPGPVELFVPLINQAVIRMEQEGADGPDGYELARESFVELVIRTRAVAVGRGAITVEPEDLQAALRGFCPRWPIC